MRHSQTRPTAMGRAIERVVRRVCTAVSLRFRGKRGEGRRASPKPAAAAPASRASSSTRMVIVPLEGSAAGCALPDLGRESLLVGGTSCICTKMAREVSNRHGSKLLAELSAHRSGDREATDCTPENARRSWHDVVGCAIIIAKT